MHITVISGSHRRDGQSHKVAAYLAHQCEKLFDATTWVMKLSDIDLPLWEEGVWQGDALWQERLKPIKDELQKADGVIVVVPEYNGMASAAVKNFFLCIGAAEVGHKPGLLVGVSAGTGGTMPIAELRMSSYKNCRINYIPEHLVVRNAARVLNYKPEDNDAKDDAYIRPRIDFALGVFEEYAKALKVVRASGKITHEKYPNGM
jgi:NAD(P)H-dependent FMN reductase